VLEPKLVAATFLVLFVLVVLVYYVWKDWRRYWPNLVGFVLTGLMILSAYVLHALTGLPASVVVLVLVPLIALAGFFAQRLAKRHQVDPAPDEPTLPPPD
jgi:urea transporter